MVEIKTTEDAIVFCQKLVQKASESVKSDYADNGEAMRNILETVKELYDNVTWILQFGKYLVKYGETLVFTEDGSLVDVISKQD